MKYRTVALLAVIILLLFCYSYWDKKSDANLFNISKIRAIEKEAMHRKTEINDVACISYLDSLQQNSRQDSTDVYFYFLNILKIKFDSKISFENKSVLLLKYSHASSFLHLHEYNKFKTRLELSMALEEIGNITAAIEEAILAAQYIEPQYNIYNFELAKLMAYLGYLSLNKFHDYEKAKDFYSQAQKIYANGKYTENSLYMFCNLGIILHDLKQYDLAIYYTNQALSNSIKPNSELPFYWSDCNAILFKCYQNTDKTDSALFVRNRVKEAYKSHSINEETYHRFLAETLGSMVLLKNYTEVENNISELVSFYKNSYVNRYEYTLIYHAKALISKSKNDKKNQYQNLIKLLYYSSECGPTDYYYSKIYSKTLDQLIEIDSTLGHNQNVALWYKKKWALSNQYEVEKEIYLKHSNFWAHLNIKPIQLENDIQKEKLENERIKFILLSLFSIFVLSSLGVIFYLYKKMENKSIIISMQNNQMSVLVNNLKISNISLNNRNEELNLLYTEVRKKTDTIASQNEQMQDFMNKLRENNVEMGVLISKLKESNENLSHFAHAAAHDLKAPLRTISNFSRLLQRRYSSKIDEKDADFFKFIIESCISLDKVIEGLLQFSTISNNTESLNSVNITKSIQSVLQNLHITLKESQAQINYPKSIPLVKGQPALIEQLFLNLINNAIKFRKKDTPSVINISFDDSDQTLLKISLSDNGIGIDPIFHKDIFQMFRKLHAPSDYTGSGIGLATCQKIINKLGGEIWVESKIGQGATFVFTLLKV